MQTLPAAPVAHEHAPYAGVPGNGHEAPQQRAPKGPSIISRLARALGRLLVLAVLAAAAVAGWFGYERFIVPQLDATIDTSTADATNPWPRDLLRSPAPWSAYTVSDVAAGIVVRDVQIDTTTGSMRATTRGADGGAVETVEFAGGRAWILASTDPNWREIVEPELDNVWNDRLALTEPLTLARLVPPEGLAHVTVVSGQLVDDLRRFVVSIDAQGFQRSAPVAHQAWVDRIAGDAGPTLQWEVAVDAEGRVVELSRSGLPDRRWDELATPVVLESPANTIAAAPGSVDDPVADEQASPTDGSTEATPTPDAEATPAPAAEAWPYSTVTITENGEWRGTRNFDRESGIVQDLTIDGTPRIEFMRTGGHQLEEGAWRSMADAGLTPDDVAALHDAFRLQSYPPFLAELLPQGVPFVETVGEDPIDGGLRLTLAYDLQGWSTTHPESYQQVVDTSLSLLGDANNTLVVDVTSDEVVTRMTDQNGAYVYAWTQRLQPVELASPLVAN